MRMVAQAPSDGTDAVATERITSSAYGRVVSVTTHAIPVESIRPHLPHWWQDCAAPADHDVVITEGCDVDEVIRGLEFWVAEHAADAVFVHAGVVSVGNRALLVPGRSHTGKSRLTAALLKAGADYGSDEYAVLTRDGLVRAYPRPLALRGPHGIDDVPAERLGARTFTGALRIGMVADVRFQEGSPWSVAPMTTGQAVLHLIDNAVAAQSRSQDVLDAAVAATRSLYAAVRGVHGDADVAAAHLLAALREGATE